MLADPEHQFLNSAGVGQSDYKGTMYWDRTSFVIDPKGNLRRTYLKVQPQGHERALLDEIGRAEALERGREKNEPLTGKGVGPKRDAGMVERNRVLLLSERRSGEQDPAASIIQAVDPCLTLQELAHLAFVQRTENVVLLGPMPTPAVAMLTRSMRADLGVMISASHNPYADNGIKLFGPDGYKLSDEAERAIERRLDTEPKRAKPEMIGRAMRIDDARGRYIHFAKSTFPEHLRLDGLKIVVDCANGASYHVAPEALWELGADVVALGVTPNGTNINDACGSTHPEALQAKVIEEKADIGLALDGDADRLLVVDQKGRMVDGDQLMALIALQRKRTGQLKGGSVVATVMSNLGLERRLAAKKVGLIRTQVGDRYVLEEMRKTGCNVGGEQSGHIILSDYSTTGDGLVAGLRQAGFHTGQRRTSSDCLAVVAGGWQGHRRRLAGYERQVKRLVKRLRPLWEVTVDEYGPATGAPVLEGFEAYVAIYHRSWKRPMSPPMHTLEREFVRRTASLGWPRVFVLRLDGHHHRAGGTPHRDLGLVHRHVGEEALAGDVADRPDARNVRAAAVISLHAAWFELHADSFEVEALDVRTAAGGDEDLDFPLRDAGRFQRGQHGPQRGQG
mgnify:CR=1 FL=1